MQRRRPALDELMIVNPGGGGGDVVLMDRDGGRYRLRWLSRARPAAVGPPPARYRHHGCRRHRLLLGEDGTLYRVLD